jgi:hypothetical protein
VEGEVVGNSQGSLPGGGGVLGWVLTSAKYQGFGVWQSMSRKDKLQG